LDFSNTLSGFRNKMGKKIIKKILNISKIFLFIWSISYANLPVAGEYEVKAVFLLNFANFVTWSPDAFSSPNDPFYICVFGDNPFADALNITIENVTVEGHNVKARYFKDLEELNSCHVLFISHSEEKNLAIILQNIKNQPVLTISDIENFVVQGGMIQFFKHGKKKKIRFYIDPITIKEANLVISANLLRIANIISRPYPTQ